MSDIDRLKTGIEKRMAVAGGAADSGRWFLRYGEAVLALIREYEQAVEFYERPENRHIPAGEVHGLERAIILLAEAYA